MSSPPAASAPINPLKARLDAGKPGLGVLVTTPGVAVTQTLVDAGFDWLFFDLEHAPIGIESVHAMITATSGSRTAPIARVPWNVPWLAKPILDAGAMGIIFPLIRSAEEAEAAVRALRYPPDGDRGFGPFYAAMRFGATMQTYPDPADREILCILLIEHRDAVDDIERIVQVPGVDVCFIAPFDLAMSYGYRDSADHPEVHAGIEKVERMVNDSPVHLGGLALDNDLANAMIERGYRLMLHGFDTLLLQRAAADILGGVDRGD